MYRTQACFLINQYFRGFVQSHYCAKSNCTTHRRDTDCHLRTLIKLKVYNQQPNLIIRSIHSGPISVLSTFYTLFFLDKKRVAKASRVRCPETDSSSMILKALEFENFVNRFFGVKLNKAKVRDACITVAH